MTFPATRWTLIVAAGQSENPAAGEALAELCRSYWYPVYAFVRRSGYAAADAEDLTQGFFVRFLERRDVTSAERAKGRFRSFLLTAVKHFLADEADRRNTQKRGGARRAVPLHLESAERRYSNVAANHETPERAYERAWARTLIARVNNDLRESFGREGRLAEFDSLKSFLPGSETQYTYAEAAQAGGTTEGALKVAVHRLRRRFRELFQAEIARLVEDPAMIADEIQHLLQTLRI